MPFIHWGRNNASIDVDAIVKEGISTAGSSLTRAAATNDCWSDVPGAHSRR